MPKLLLLALLVLGSTSARQLLLRPLSREELSELRQSQPEGRSVRTGLAALTGYTLGLSKALVGVFIYDVITANVSSVANATNNGYAQQICFNTRDMQEESARSNNNNNNNSNNNDYNPYEDDDVYDNVGRQTNIDTDTDTETDPDTSTDYVDTTTANAADSNVATCIVLYRNR